LDQIFTLREVVASRKERKLPTYMAFLDVRRAYDRVWRDGLLLKLLEAGVSGQMFLLLQSMLNANKRQVVVGGEASDTFETTVGLPQGAVLSPLLYALFINGLAEELNSAAFGVDVFGRRVALLLYADDIVLMAESPEQLQSMLDHTSRYARQWQFRFNTKPGKSDVVICGTPKQCQVALPQFRLGEGVLQVSPQYKYLGVEVGKIGPAEWSAYIQRAVSKADAAMRQLAYSVMGRSQLRITTAVHLFKTLVRPVLEYGNAIWGAMCSQSDLKRLEQVQKSFGRRVLRLQNQVSSEFVRRELGLESMQERVTLATMRFFGKLSVMPDSRLAGFVFRKRCEQVDDDQPNPGKWSWCRVAKRLLSELGQVKVWEERTVPADWRVQVRRAVRAEFKQRSDQALKQKPGLALFGQLGPASVDGWLDRAARHPGAALRVKLRCNAAPLMAKVGENAKLPMEERKCRLCETGEVETAEHFAAVCPFNAKERADCLNQVESLLGAGGSVKAREAVAARDVSVFLGDGWLQGLPKPLVQQVDAVVCNFLKIAWRRRKPRWQTFCDGNEWKLKIDKDGSLVLSGQRSVL
jgi:hypothetical protein